MSEKWINQSEDILKLLKNLKTKKDKDRLEIINSLIFTLNAIDRSIHGWRGWVQNLGFMSNFTKDELTDLEEGLIKSTRSFIEYDIEITKKHMEKIPTIKFTEKRRKAKPEIDVQGLYT